MLSLAPAPGHSHPSLCWPSALGSRVLLVQWPLHLPLPKSPLSVYGAPSCATAHAISLQPVTSLASGVMYKSCFSDIFSLLPVLGYSSYTTVLRAFLQSPISVVSKVRQKTTLSSTILESSLGPQY